MLDISAYQVGQKIGGSATLKVGKTMPPKQFVEGDLVDIMDDIGRYAQIGKEEMAVLKQKNQTGSGKAGIGTARTRGEIINKLFDAEFLKKDKAGKLTPTEKGMQLYKLLNERGVACALVSPEMTAQWERGLEKIEKGEITVERFMSQLEPFIRQMVADMMSNPTNPMFGKTRSAAAAPDVEPHPMHGEACPKCKKGKLITGLVTKETSKSFGQRYVRCDAGKDKCDFFGEFVK